MLKGKLKHNCAQYIRGADPELAGAGICSGSDRIRTHNPVEMPSRQLLRVKG